MTLETDSHIPLSREPATERIIEPNPAVAAVYDDLFARYVALYQAVNAA